MQTLESLIRQRDRAPRIIGRTWSRSKRGPGRSPRDRQPRLTLRARLSKRIRRRRRNRRRALEAQGLQVIRA